MNAERAEAFSPLTQQMKSSTILTSKAFYWVVVIASSVLLLWGWSLAIKNLIQGTTVLGG